jgi:hypothetical protein
MNITVYNTQISTLLLLNCTLSVAQLKIVKPNGSQSLHLVHRDLMVTPVLLLVMPPVFPPILLEDHLLFTFCASASTPPRAEFTGFPGFIGEVNLTLEVCHPMNEEHLSSVCWALAVKNSVRAYSWPSVDRFDACQRLRCCNLSARTSPQFDLLEHRLGVASYCVDNLKAESGKLSKGLRDQSCNRVLEDGYYIAFLWSWGSHSTL